MRAVFLNEKHWNAVNEVKERELFVFTEISCDIS